MANCSHPRANLELAAQTAYGLVKLSKFHKLRCQLVVGCADLPVLALSHSKRQDETRPVSHIRQRSRPLLHSHRCRSLAESIQVAERWSVLLPATDLPSTNP